jgi:pantoate--beta-alanine ligase
VKLVKDLDDWDEARSGMIGTVGLVPTMGALHDGHLSLIDRSCRDNDNTVVTVFVNGPQFNDSSDLEAYPRDLARDAVAAEGAGASVALAPSHEALYPDGYRYRVTENEHSGIMEGAHRPGHFDGMLTVVLKLINLVQPDCAYFGEKDWQQLQLVRGMVEALLLPVEIVACPTRRDRDGLAMSSRNALLSETSRKAAAEFPRLLASGDDAEVVRTSLETAGFEVDYVQDQDGRRLAAVHLDGVRLIDNIPLGD